MKNEFKIILSILILLISISLFGILYSLSAKTVETYPTIFAIGLATIFAGTMFSIFHYGFNNRS
jgi:hypothetical protein